MGAAGAAGTEIEITAQNAGQILQNPGALLLQVGVLSEAISKKILRLRMAAAGRLPLVHLNCQSLPQVCQALQITSSPTVLLMARGQVAAALENDLTPPAVTAFVENVARMLGVKVDLAEGISEQLAAAEETEWSDPASAEEAFLQLGQTPDLPNDARVRVAAGRVRCALRQKGRLEEAKGYFRQLEAGGHGRVPEVKQAAAMLQLAEGSDASAPLGVLKEASAAVPADVAAADAYARALFWAGREGEAIDAGLLLLRRNPRAEGAKQLVLTLVEALGPRHPRSTQARKAFNNALFI